MTAVDLRAWTCAGGLTQVVVESVPRPFAHAVRGVLDANTGDHPVRVVLTTAFPSEPPLVWLLDPPAERRAHVMADGRLCWIPDDALLDPSRPDRIVADCLSECRRLLEMSPERSEEDLLDELESYWSQIPGGRGAWAQLDGVDRPRRLYRVRAGGRIVGFTTRGRPAPAGLWAQVDTVEPAGLVVPLTPGPVPLPDVGQGLDVSWLRSLLRGRVLPRHRRAVDRLTRAASPGGDLLVLMVPRGADRRPAVLGVDLRARGRRHAIRGGRADVQRVAVQRRDRDAILPGGPVAERLQRCRVAVVGVGAVGGHVAVELARAGVGWLTLVDGDYLEPRNVYRHVLGARWLGQNKSAALALYLAEELPCVKVLPVPAFVQAAWPPEVADIAAHDAVVIAVDRPSVALWIHGKLREAGSHTGVMVWLEALGVAAHSLRFGEDGPGCLECMYTDVTTGEFRECAFHLAEAGQDLTGDLGGCGSRTAPFGSVDAVRAATLAVRHVVEALAHGHRHTELVTWKGDLASFRAAGFQLSARAAVGGEIVRYTGVQLARSGCRWCGG